MGRCIIEEAENVLDKEFPVLDKGFVRLIDYLGGDRRIVEAARVSYGKGTKSYREDRGLIRYLMRNDHTSPFEQVVLTYHCKMPIFVARQWIRHRTARVNEISGRYSVLADEFYMPEGASISAQNPDNKQGRASEPVPQETQDEVRSDFAAAQEQAYGRYRKMIDKGIARELARINLPLSLYTEWYWQIDLHNLFHFLRLRMDPHAQFEIREYARIMFDLARTVCPAACEAFEDYKVYGVQFSRNELKALKLLLSGSPPDLEQLKEKAGLSSGEAKEFLKKLGREP